MLLPEPQLLKLMKLTAHPSTPTRRQLPGAAQAIIIYALMEGTEPLDEQDGAPCTALAVRRKHAIFCIRSIGAKPTRR